jgi:hypothetical protein
MSERKVDRELEERFTTVFNQRLWGENESLSGPGSRKDNPMVVSAIQALDAVLDQFPIASVADIPCGDFNFLGPVFERHPLVHYTGYDIVSGLIDANRAKFPSFAFEVLDIVSDVPPRVDLIFTKELLIHLPNHYVMAALRNMKASGATYLMASNSPGVVNEELEHNSLGYARPIDLMAVPYSFPQPLWRNNFYALWEAQAITL